jgi:hypothetical protein
MMVDAYEESVLAMIRLPWYTQRRAGAVVGEECEELFEIAAIGL